MFGIFKKPNPLKDLQSIKEHFYNLHPDVREIIIIQGAGLIEDLRRKGVKSRKEANEIITLLKHKSIIENRIKDASAPQFILYEYFLCALLALHYPNSSIEGRNSIFEYFEYSDRYNEITDYFINLS